MERECELNGHRDDGRGVCVECGEFLQPQDTVMKRLMTHEEFSVLADMGMI